jgi:hypothetical protein
VAVTGVLPRIAGDLESPADAASGQHYGFGVEQLEPAAFAIVGQRADAPVAILQQGEDGGFHMEIDALMNAVILEGADHFKTRAIAYMGEPRIAMAAEVALENFAVRGAVEHGSPGFELADARRSFLGVELGHAPVVEILASAHGIGEVDSPVVAIVHVAHGGGHSAFGHHGMSFSE